MNSTNCQDVDESVSLLFADEDGPAKKRKLSVGATSLSGVQLKVLQFENQTLKQLVEELENENRKLQQNDTDELNTKIIKLESTNAELASKNEQYKTKIKTLEDKNDENEAQIKELNDQNLSMKNIKEEIKDSVEDERESVRTANVKLKKEIKELKKKNNDLQLVNQKLLDSHIVEIRNLKQQKQDLEGKVESSVKSEEKMAAKIQILQKKINELEQLNQKLLESHINELKKLLQQNQDVEKAVQNLKESVKDAEKIKVNTEMEKVEEIDKLKKKLANTPKFNVNPSEKSIVAKAAPKVSSASVKIINIAKIEGTEEGWKLYHVADQSVEPYFIKNEGMNILYNVKLNITEQLIVHSKTSMSMLMQIINSCDLKVLHLVDQTISLDDFFVLVSSKKVEICILENVVFNGVEHYFINKVLSSLPNVKEFKYKFYLEGQSGVAKNLANLPSFNNLQKFELLNLSTFFKLEEMEGFLKKNKHDATYIFTFGPLRARLQNKIKQNGNELLKSLPLHTKISVVFE